MNETKKQTYKFLKQNFYKGLQPNVTTTKEGILFFNSSDDKEDNAMPQKLLDLRLKSAIHRNLLELKSSLIATKGGLFPEDDSNTSLADFIKSRNGRGEAVNKVWSMCSTDFANFEQCYVEVIYNGEGKVAELYHKPFNTIRAGEPEGDYDLVQNYYYSTTWGDVTNKKNKGKRNDISNAIRIPAFNPNTISESGGRQILHIKKYDASGEEYVTPSYLSAEKWINTVWLIGEYVQNKFENGYHLDGFMFFNSNMSEEDQDQFMNDFNNKHKGTKGKKIIFVFSDSANAAPQFVPIADTLKSSIFRDFVTEATKEIVWSHSASLELLSLSNSDSFGSTNPDSNDINVSRLKYINDVIVPYQSDLLDGFNRIFEINGLGTATVLNDILKLTIPELQPDDTTVNERREIVLGLNPIDEANNTDVNPLIQ